MGRLALDDRSIALIKPFKRNARIHSRKQIDQIARSISAFGFNVPVLIDQDGEVIAGHGRLLAAQLLELDTIPVVTLSDLTEAQKRAFRLADNRLAENSAWDVDLVMEEIQRLAEIEADLDFSVTTEIGFSDAELDFYLGVDKKTAESDGCEEIDVPKQPFSRLGDCYQLGRHRLLCGDAREPLNYRLLLEGCLTDMVITDVPYNLPIQGHVSGLGKHKHSNFVMASGEMTPAEYRDLLRASLGAMAEVSKPGAVHFIFIDWRSVQELQEAVAGIYSQLLNICVWNKSNAGMGSLYRSKHELILVQKVGSEPHTNNVELGRNGRYRTNVWDYSGYTSFGPQRSEALSMHPTVKPVRLIADAIQDCSKRGEKVLDGFCGSGSSLLAAERVKRIAFGMELDPFYVDVTLNRWMRVTGEEPTLLPDKLKWSDVRERRRATTQAAPSKSVSGRDA